MVANNRHNPIVNTKDKKIDQIGIVVKDAAKTAIKYSEIFGIGPWIFLDFAASDMKFKKENIPEGSSVVRAALTNIGKIQIELLQPLYGSGTHASFLKERGEGIHHVSFGMVDDHDKAVSALKEKGIAVEMEGVLGGSLKFTYMDTLKDLGTIFEFAKPPLAPPQGLNIWGNYVPKGQGIINLEKKEIKQLGVVVEDAEKTAKNYWEVFGVGPWMLVDFKPPHVCDCKLHGIDMADGTPFHVKAALADLGDMQIELLQPITGPSTYMEFLKTFGQGIHHVSFGEAEDHDEFVSTMQNNGIEIEMCGVLGDAIRFTYMATQNKLGTIFEVIKTDPNKKITLLPYGMYPDA